jgi:hypothetical protein
LERKSCLLLRLLLRLETTTLKTAKAGKRILPQKQKKEPNFDA